MIELSQPMPTHFDNVSVTFSKIHKFPIGHKKDTYSLSFT